MPVFVHLEQKRSKGPTDEGLKYTTNSRHSNASTSTSYNQTENERRETTYQMLTQIGENDIGMGC